MNLARGLEPLHHAALKVGMPCPAGEEDAAAKEDLATWNAAAKLAAAPLAKASD